MLLNREVQKKDIEKILKQGGFNCGCGKYHSTAVKDIVVSSGAAAQVPALIEKHTGKKAFLLSDLNTYEAAGKGVEKHLDDAGISYTSFVFQNPDLEPDDRAVGQAALYFDTGCDIILGIGSGTINDIGKMLAKVTGCKYIVVCTAPSMDGYASATSSMIRDGIKVSPQCMSMRGSSGFGYYKQGSRQAFTSRTWGYAGKVHQSLRVEDFKRYYRRILLRRNSQHGSFFTKKLHISIRRFEKPGSGSGKGFY